MDARSKPGGPNKTINLPLFFFATIRSWLQDKTERLGIYEEEEKSWGFS
jgi:hypothetical protein